MEKDRIYYETKATYEEWLEWYNNKEKQNYPNCYLTVDNLILRWNNETEKIELLLIKRKQHPFKDYFAFTGGFVNPNENAQQAVIRETFEETGIKINKDYVNELCSLTTPNRDPRHWIVSIAHIVYLPFNEKINLVAGSDSEEVKWFNLEEVKKMKLAFDHREILKKAIFFLKEDIKYKKQIINILPKKFRISTLQKMYSQIEVKYRTYGMSNFFVLMKEDLVFTGDFSFGKKGRNAKLYAKKK